MTSEAKTAIGVDAVGDRLRVWLEATGISCETLPHDVFGDCLAARVLGPGGRNRPIVLMGHRDTVFPDGTAARRPFRIDGNQACLSLEAFSGACPYSWDEINQEDWYPVSPETEAK